MRQEALDLSILLNTNGKEVLNFIIDQLVSNLTEKSTRSSFRHDSCSTLPRRISLTILLKENNMAGDYELLLLES